MKAPKTVLELLVDFEEGLLRATGDGPVEIRLPWGAYSTLLREMEGRLRYASLPNGDLDGRAVVLASGLIVRTR